MPEYTIVESESGFLTEFQLNGASFDAVQGALDTSIPIGEFSEVSFTSNDSGVSVRLASSDAEVVRVSVERLLGEVPFNSIGRQ